MRTIRYYLVKVLGASLLYLTENWMYESDHWRITHYIGFALDNIRHNIKPKA